MDISENTINSASRSNSAIVSRNGTGSCTFPKVGHLGLLQVAKRRHGWLQEPVQGRMAAMSDSLQLEKKYSAQVCNQFSLHVHSIFLCLFFLVHMDVLHL